jgi:hypothetical protein
VCYDPVSCSMLQVHKRDAVNSIRVGLAVKNKQYSLCACTLCAWMSKAAPDSITPQWSDCSACCFMEQAAPHISFIYEVVKSHLGFLTFPQNQHEQIHNKHTLYHILSASTENEEVHNGDITRLGR